MPFPHNLLHNFKKIISFAIAVAHDHSTCLYILWCRVGADIVEKRLSCALFLTVIKSRKLIILSKNKATVDAH